jgi:hypothetical protein
MRTLMIYLYLTGMHLTGVYLIGVYLIGVCLMGVYLRLVFEPPRNPFETITNALDDFGQPTSCLLTY